MPKPFRCERRARVAENETAPEADGVNNADDVGGILNSGSHRVPSYLFFCTGAFHDGLASVFVLFWSDETIRAGVATIGKATR